LKEKLTSANTYRAAHNKVATKIKKSGFTRDAQQYEFFMCNDSVALVFLVNPSFSGAQQDEFLMIRINKSTRLMLQTASPVIFGLSLPPSNDITPALFRLCGF
jgi:hypothetical protein